MTSIRAGEIIVCHQFIRQAGNGKRCRRVMLIAEHPVITEI